MRTPRRNPSAHGIRALSLGLLTLVASCSSVEIEGAPRFRAHPGDRFAWSAPPPEGAEGAQDLPLKEVREAVERALVERGLVVSPLEEALLFLRTRATVDVVLRENHPYYDMNVAERFEDGTLAIELRDRESGELLWRGSNTRRLRTVETTMGGAAATTWTRTDEVRDWPIEEEVERILDRLPLARGEREEEPTP